jgi:hypothetical protein
VIFQVRCGGLQLKNAYETAPGSGFLMKLDPSGTDVTFSTYFAGVIYGVAADNDENVYVTGPATSPNFPLKNSLQQFLG